MHILEVGNWKCDLQCEVLRVFILMLQYQIYNEPSWIPREQNQCTDYLSHIAHNNDWQLNPMIFSVLDSMFGLCTTDRLANAHNTHLVQFNSHYWNPGLAAVDAFTVNWVGRIITLVPL